MGGGGVCVRAVNIQTCKGVRGMLPGKILKILDCLGLHFARFHGGEREKENVELLKEKVNRQCLILLKIAAAWLVFLSNGWPNKIQLRHSEVLAG